MLPLYKAICQGAEGSGRVKTKEDKLSSAQIYYIIILAMFATLSKCAGAMDYVHVGARPQKTLETHRGQRERTWKGSELVKKRRKGGNTHTQGLGEPKIWPNQPPQTTTLGSCLHPWRHQYLSTPKWDFHHPPAPPICFQGSMSMSTGLLLVG